MSGRAQVVARRWDGIGGRLNALVNAAALASAHGLELRFAWPDTPEVPSSDPAELFDRDFLETHLVEPSSLDDRPPIWCRDVNDALDRRSELLAGGCEGDPFLDVDEPFDVHPGLGGGTQGSAALAAAFAAIPWADGLGRVLDGVAGWPAEGERWTGVHIRAGDVVTGAWRRTLWHEKYQVVPFLRAAIEGARARGDRVLLVTDHPALADWLARDLAGPSRPAEILPGYAGLTDAQQAVADIVLLSRCATIIGPPRSALSGLAAGLAGVGVSQPSDQPDPGTARRVLEAGIAAQLADREHRALLAPVTARDIAWYADVFGGSLPARRLVGLLEAATALDPEFAGAWARLARASARRCRWKDAHRAVTAAAACAEADERQDDGRFEAAVSTAVVECTWTLRHAWMPGRARQRHLDRARSSLASARALRPWHTLTGALAASDALVDQVSAVLGARWPHRVRAAAALSGRLAGPLDPSGAPRRLAAVRTGSFDWMSDELDALSLRCAGTTRDDDRIGDGGGPPAAP